MQIVIMSGGLSTRLGPLTSRIPKAMVDVRGRPFLEHQLELLKRHGVDDVVLCVGHLSETIESHFGDGKRLGLRIRYSHDGPQLLGTAGALKRASRLLDQAFLMLDGDTYLPVDYRDVWAHFEYRRKAALMVVYKNKDRYDKSNVAVEAGLVKTYDRSRTATGLESIHAGLSVLTHETLALIPDGRPSGQDEMWAQLIARGELAAYETDQRFYEIGSVSGLEEFRRLAEPGKVIG